MLQKLCLMASHGCSPGLVLQQELAMVGSIMKGCQPLLPSPVAKPEIIRYQSPSLRLNPSEVSRKSQNEWFNSNQFVNVDLSAQRPMHIDVQATCPSPILFSFGIVEQCTECDNILQFIMSGTAEAGIGGGHLSLLSDLMDLQLSGIDEPQQLLTPLIYPNRKFYIPKPLLDIFQDSPLSSKIKVHPDGQVTFMGTAIEMKDLLSVVAESHLSQSTHKNEKQSMLVPHFSRLNIDEVESIRHSSTLDIHSTLTVPLRSPEKVKFKPSQKKNKKVTRDRDLYKKNYLHACESLLFLMVNKRQHRKTAILSLKKSGPELPELLTQFSAGIAGTGLAVLLSVICKLACGRVPLCASKLFNTGFGFGLVWLSWAVNKLRDTIVSTSKNVGKLGLKDEVMIHKVDKSLREVYFRAATLLAVAVLRLA
ncbi:uncharacterized protein LOC133294554 isoform X2 [Gastrolobium bilobum]|uniref:uncharacterized protein LOC133294554 isoform X2 n=1 Tax=Gastrolobium bilobum TaxID=150636 RepID=UPI002AB0F2F3|nr:uncharacterized protein LOC133294554 isoform X2 [Gastrolobium bilobum]